jgi:exonuclease III
MATYLSNDIVKSNDKFLNIVSFNMHGFNQGIIQLKTLCNINQYEVIFLQEHWLTSDTIAQFNYFSKDYLFYGVCYGFCCWY